MKSKSCAMSKATPMKSKMGGMPKKPSFKQGGWIQDTHMKEGILRAALGAKKGHNIPESKLDKATHSKNPTLKKEAVLAKTLKSFHKKGR